MTSVLNVDTIADKAGTGPVAFTKQHVSKCYAQWDMSGTAHINDSFAVSSLTDSGTGVAQITFTNSFDSAEYGFSTGVGETNGGGNRGIGARGTSPGIAAGFMTLFSFTMPSEGGTSASDVNLCAANWHGDLA